MRIEGKKDTILFLQKNNIKIVKIHGSRENEELIIPFNQISSIQVKKPGRFQKGYIQFKTTSIMQRFVWFTGEVNYNIAIKMQKLITEYKFEDLSPKQSINKRDTSPKVTVKVPDTIGEFKLEYKYENIEVLLSDSIDRQLLGEFVDITVDGENVLISAKGKKIGQVVSEKISKMIMDFHKKEEPVSAVLSGLDDNKAFLFLLFYKLPKYKRLLNKGACHKEFKLTGTNKSDFQDNIRLCSVGEEIDFSFDEENEKYLAACGLDIGYFPKSANSLLENYPDAFINSINEDDEGKAFVIVSVFE